MSKSDSWCNPLLTKKGVRVSGGAARQVRISELGGMDEIIDAIAKKVAKDAIADFIKLANEASKPKLKVV